MVSAVPAGVAAVRLVPNSSFEEHFEQTTLPETNMVVSKNRGIPKWMVYNGKPYSNG